MSKRGATAPEQGFEPGLFETRRGSSVFSLRPSCSYWDYYYMTKWGKSQGKRGWTQGGPFYFKDEGWQLKVPLEYLT